ncbi:MAG: response regulator transcription factor [Lachnospiraceae bacterium]|nr:response regulator transcription factor [Lachnospiraceae bacterium]
MDRQKILIVDDEERMRKLLRDFLTRAGYEVFEAGDGQQALEIFLERKDLDLILLDVMMPKLDGWQTLTEIRRYSNVPVIMLTARSEEQDELRGFSLGVDEYVTKPFSPRVLTARIGVVLRRSASAREEILEAAGIRLDKSAHTVTVDGTPVELSFKEFELLTYFMENPGVALTRENILNHVWNYNYYGDARTIDTHVKKLRSKIGEKGELIKTIWGVGYKFEAE